MIGQSEEMEEHLISPSPEAPGPGSGWLQREIRSWLRDLAIAVSLAMFIVLFLYQPVKVEGTSMVPALSDQERIFINKFVYHFQPIRRGDVVVFWYPLDPTKSFIKRVVGLPGETVALEGGRVYVDGNEMREPYVLPQYLDDSSYPPVRVPSGHYYVMGDHRDSSNDSRVFGPVPRRFIYGKAVFAYWPFDRFGIISEFKAGSPK
ncbi:MAG TPA: signal peptidase I [Candidatus Acidoferrales bacterium]|nr:signal peptidase I [Candidatus Acidoferrales bacterium]